MERERFYLGGGSIFRQWCMWYLDVTTSDGNRVRKSLQTRDKDTALVRAAQFLSKRDFKAFWSSSPEIRLERMESALAPVLESEEISSVVRQEVRRAMGLPDLIADVSCNQALKEFLADHKNKDHAASYVQNLNRQIGRFIVHAKVSLVIEVEAKHVLTWNTSNRDGGDGQKSVFDKWQAISSWLNFCRQRGWIEKNVAETLHPGEPDKKAVRFFTSSEVVKILSEADRDPQVSAALAIAIYAGLRREEIFNLDWKDVDLESRAIRVRALKTNEIREVPILDQLLQPLLKLSGRTGRVLARWKDISAFARIVQRTITNALCGKPKPGRAREQEPDENPGLNVCRHSFSTWIQSNGVAPTVAAQWCGHSVATQQAKYTGRVGLGSQPLAMTYAGKKLESHGVPQVPVSAQKQARLRR